ncbi:MAG: ABC-2 transporter permease [Gemmatimonadota bacterium]|nr:MAG: ABC-2 transporter permease [Gemmatimonadota bacterium]
MFRVILQSHWSWSKLLLGPGIVAAFALPILSVQQAGNLSDPQLSAWGTAGVLHEMEEWGIWYAALAAALGLALATSAWASDHRGGHAYALSLPVERWRYVLLRYASGVVLLAAPIVFFWLGALLAAAAIELPDGFHAYPTALAMRFALAALLAFSVFFSISAGTARTAGYILVPIGGLLAAQLLLTTAGVGFDPLAYVIGRLTSWPGPFEVFTGRWMLIDV